jgi:cation transport protein ChaC
MVLTRADLTSHRLQQMLSQPELGLYVLNETELQSSIDETLEKHPHNADIWLFAYGSLIWNPLFRFVDRQVGTVYGWHRRFCLWAPAGRGTLENPGLVLALERGGCCRGIAYRIAAADVSSELLLVWRREMVVGSYIPRWVRVFDGSRSIRAIAFTINRHHPCYAANLSLSVTARHIATASGQLGSCMDYLVNTVNGLSSVGIRDCHLLQLYHQAQASE